MIDLCRRIYDSMEDPKIYRVRGNTGLYPSQGSIVLENGNVAGGCHRQVYYQWKKFKPTEESVTDYSLAAEMGNWFHEGIMSYLKNHVFSTDIIVLSEEQSFYNNHMVSGRTDAFLMDNKTKDIFGLEIKSVGEFAGKAALVQPSYSNLIQAAIYLNEYQITASKGNRNIDYWKILYISRDENWDLKARKHGSPFRYMWEYTCKFEEGILVVYNQHGSKEVYPEITVKNIYDRYDKIRKELKENKLPDRDFEAQYSEEKIVSLYESGLIQYKKDQAVVEKWMKKGAVEGELQLQLGDKECMFCAWKSLCYSDDPSKGEPLDQILFNIPKKEPKKVTSKSINIL